MDVATDRLSEQLRLLSQRVSNGGYGSDINFDSDAFLQDLQDDIVDMFGEEICKR